jgi:membrane protein YqaA with SNARE-associated domain
VLLAALDSTIFISLPFGIDAAVIILAAHLQATAWIVPLLATTGSLVGAAASFGMGHKAGEAGLERYVAPKRLERIRKRVKDTGALTLAALDLIPPPFPFTPFVLAAGALKVSARTFFATLAVCRLFRFGVESWLATRYGEQIIGWMESPWFRGVIGLLILAAVVLTAISAYQLIRSSRPAARRAAA